VIHVEIAPGTVVRLDRRAVAAVASAPEEETGEEPETTQPEQAASDDAS
jgi:hypothetical protein